MKLTIADSILKPPGEIYREIGCAIRGNASNRTVFPNTTGAHFLGEGHSNCRPNRSFLILCGAVASISAVLKGVCFCVSGAVSVAWLPFAFFACWVKARRGESEMRKSAAGILEKIATWPTVPYGYFLESLFTKGGSGYGACKMLDGCYDGIRKKLANVEDGSDANLSSVGVDASYGGSYDPGSPLYPPPPDDQDSQQPCQYDLYAPLYPPPPNGSGRESGQPHPFDPYCGLFGFYPGCGTFIPTDCASPYDSVTGSGSRVYGENYF